MEFKEYSNPEERDYDVTSSFNVIEGNPEINNKRTNSYKEFLLDMVGFLEDGEWEDYGITYEEYMNPTSETIDKVYSAMEQRRKIG